jgi:hypothetical protein
MHYGAYFLQSLSTDESNLSVVFNLIFSQISVTDVHLHSIVFTALDMPLPKLYAVSVIVDAQRAAHHYREPQQ